MYCRSLVFGIAATVPAGSARLVTRSFTVRVSPDSDTSSPAMSIPGTFAPPMTG